MFAMTSLVGTPVVAAPARATRAVRSTKTVALFGKAKAAPKKGAKKVRPKPEPPASVSDGDPLPPG